MSNGEQAERDANSVLSRFLELVKSNPLFYAGLIFIALAFYRPSGNWKLERADPAAWPLFGVGCVLLALGISRVLREARKQAKDRFADPAAYEAQFWHEVFDAFPPAFIKSVEIDDEKQITGEPIHIAENRAFDRFQGAGAGDPSDEVLRDIRTDHHDGDQLAVMSDRSCSLESSDTHGLSSQRQIVTFKQKFQYGSNLYIIGWYLPVELPPRLPAADVLYVRDLGHQPVFRLVQPRSDREPSFKLRIGKSARRAAEGDSASGEAPDA